LAALAGITALAAIVRIWAAQDEFWFDEIWTLLGLQQNIHSPLEIFTAHHDNNHYLMTLWMYLVAPQRDWFVYRLPSVAAGVGTVVLAAHFARRFGAAASVLAALLTGGSFMLIVYASEARGYAMAGFFALAALLALDRFLVRRSITACAAFAVATALGTLSHLTFVQVYCGAAAWSLLSLCNSAATRREAIGSWARLHAAPVAFFATLYAVDVRSLSFGGGDPYVMRDVLANAMALALGGNATRPMWALVNVLLVAVIGATAIVALVREKADIWPLFTVAIFVAPAVFLSLDRPAVLHERYFYLNVLLFLVLLAFLLSRLLRHGRVGRATATVALALVLVGNGKRTYDFLRLGRGHFLDALDYMAERSTEVDIHIAGDAEFGYQLYAAFYAPYARPGHRFLFEKLAPHMEVEPEWIMFNSVAQSYNPAATIRDVSGRDAYVLARVFRFSGLSGANFALYRRAPDAGRDLAK
jgi:uncharacterized membrane protein